MIAISEEAGDNIRIENIKGNKNNETFNFTVLENTFPSLTNNKNYLQLYQKW
jgi:hypothetical protein